MKSLEKPVPPGGMIGIVGGGQLGRMLAMAAARLGLQTCVFNDAPDAPAFQVTPHHVVAPYEDLAALEAFAARCDAVTFEFENLPAHAIARLADQVWVAPGADALAITQDRLSEKSFVARLGLKTAPFREVSSEQQARDAFEPEDIGAGGERPQPVELMLDGGGGGGGVIHCSAPACKSDRSVILPG